MGRGNSKIESSGMAMEEFQFPERGRVIEQGNLFGAGQPEENVAVGNLQQVFEFREFRFAQPGDLGIRETAHEEIRLVHAAMDLAKMRRPS
jgi:hypothetical protein